MKPTLKLNTLFSSKVVVAAALSLAILPSVKAENSNGVQAPSCLQRYYEEIQKLDNQIAAQNEAVRLRQVVLSKQNELLPFDGFHTLEKLGNAAACVSGTVLELSAFGAPGFIGISCVIEAEAAAQRDAIEQAQIALKNYRDQINLKMDAQNNYLAPEKLSSALADLQFDYQVLANTKNDVLKQVAQSTVLCQKNLLSAAELGILSTANAKLILK